MKEFGNDGWTIVTKDHSLSAQWEHTVLVTETGYEVLTLSAGSPPPPAFVKRRLSAAGHGARPSPSPPRSTSTPRCATATAGPQGRAARRRCAAAAAHAQRRRAAAPAGARVADDALQRALAATPASGRRRAGGGRRLRPRRAVPAFRRRRAAAAARRRARRRRRPRSSSAWKASSAAAGTPAWRSAPACAPSSECLAEAAGDVTVQTSLLEVAPGRRRRERCTPASSKRFRQPLDPRAFFVAKTLEMRQRHTKFENTPYALEPNCKESPGGLRDLQVILWVAKAAGFGNSWDELAAQRPGHAPSRPSRSSATRRC